ncbi:50S ribosomal protein L12P [archaeon BMS3Abin16]|nr:50S ribosomal protein L12P [archaeon BMS3Abin16]HDY74849.1 50S ribosomal protein P1 [Euryarchaeota archaeon]
MEYVYAAMLLHSAGKEITEAGITKILKASGVEVNEARAKALVAALEDINIDDAIATAAVAPAAAAPGAAPAGEAPAAEEAAPAEEEEEPSEEEALAGLGSLFG